MKPVSREPRDATLGTRRDETKLVHAGTPGGPLSGTMSPPVYHFSTVIYDSVADYLASHHDRYGPLVYGRWGSPTTWALEDALCELEGAHDCVLAPSGLAAIHLALLASLSAGDHLLVVDTVYPPVRSLCKNELTRFGVETEYYDPLLGADIEKMIRPNTRVVYVESPGSQSFEVQDVPAIAQAAHRGNALVIVDNTWASGLYFRSFDHGADICVHAGTKYIAGHADAMMGAVLSAEHVAERVRRYWSQSGTAIGPDDAFLALRGLRTLSVRLERHAKNALAIAQWLEARPEVERVLYPALASHPQHALWRRDFRGASGLMTMVPKAASDTKVHAFIDALELFRIGASWGGYESLAVPCKVERVASPPPWPPEHSAVRLHVGIEHIDDLIADLAAAFEVMQRTEA
jgi:cysteine-S-conjugate beta-lyase